MGTKEGVGTVIGAAGGAWAGSSIGKGTGRIVATAAGTLLGGLIGNQIGRSLDRVDQMHVEQTAQQALERYPDGQSASWQNPNTGHSGYRSEEHTSELQSLMRISYAVFCLKKKNTPTITQYITPSNETIR